MRQIQVLLGRGLVGRARARATGAFCVVIWRVSFSSAEEQWEKELDNELQEFELVDDGAQNDDDDSLEDELDLK